MELRHGTWMILTMGWKGRKMATGRHLGGNCCFRGERRKYVAIVFHHLFGEDSTGDTGQALIAAS